MAATASGRAAPNILVTGTPGTGKSTLAAALAERLDFRHVDIGALIKEHGFHSGEDTEFSTLLVEEDDEERLLDELEPVAEKGGVVMDYHSNDFFPQRFFDLVLVLRTDNTVLFDRLKARGYSEKKVQENVEAEIMQVVFDEARAAYPAEAVVEVQSNSTEDMDATLERCEQWLQQWRKDHPPGTE